MQESFTVVPQFIKITRTDGEIVEVPDITLVTWKHALAFEVKTGMMMSRISASAVAKRMLGLPKGWSKKRVLETVTDLLDQLEAAKEAA